MSDEPLCVRVRREALERLPPHPDNEKALANRRWWHAVDEKEALGGCPLCAHLAGLQATEAGYVQINDNDINGQGAALVAKGIWGEDQIYTASEIAARTSRAFLKGIR